MKKRPRRQTHAMSNKEHTRTMTRQTPLLPFCLFLAHSFLIVSNPAFSDDWPQWLGPLRDAVWRETGIVGTFSDGGPPLRWKTEIGAGYSGPAVAGGRVFVMDRVEAGKIAPEDMGAYTRKNIPGRERIVCLRETDGTILWSRAYDCPYTIATNYAIGPRVTPTVDDDLVFALGAEGHLYCLNVEDGKVIWSRDFKNDFGAEIPVWGLASHPLVDDDKLICVVGGPGAVAVAFDKRTGKELWRSLTAKEPGYAPPVIYDVDGERHLLIWHSDAICGLNPETGELYWSVAIKPFAAMSIAVPRLVGHDLFLMGHRRQCWLVRIADDRRSAAIAWEGGPRDGIGGVFNTPFVEDGLIYGCDLNGGYIGARISDGQRLWTSYAPLNAERPVSWGNVFTIKHDNRFFLATDTGDLIIARLDADGYHEQSRAHLIEPTHAIGNRTLVWSHPAFANRSVYLRNDGEIRCYDLAVQR